ncbi:hypothetical protein PTKIN_Ptkin17bG0101300 [Pterospermum kingtungense]
MGNCVPVFKNKDPADMNLSAQIQSPTKENFVRREHSIAELGSRPQPLSMETSFRDLSKTDENFFDSEPWLESDCEDFFSVNGESCSNSPNHHKSLSASSLHDKNHSMDRAQNAVPEQSPTDTKKLLIELFRESTDDAVNNNQSSKEQLEDKPTTFNLPPRPTTRSPYEPIPNSVHSSEATPYVGYMPRKDKSALSPQCCLPSLGRNKSLGDRKRRLSPAKTDG